LGEKAFNAPRKRSLSSAVMLPEMSNAKTTAWARLAAASLYWKNASGCSTPSTYSLKSSCLRFRRGDPQSRFEDIQGNQIPCLPSRLLGDVAHLEETLTRDAGFDQTAAEAWR